MLQQTQVATVIPYYQRFMASFPTVQDLANAHEDEVLHQWTGLGYYARARNLHTTAKVVCSEWAGEFPTSVEELETLPGIGRSTAAAIHAISKNQRAVILDGNVKRVLARLHCVPGWYGHTAVAKQLWALAEAMTPAQRAADYTQAIMDLGATLCTRSKPRCEDCPVQSNCQAYANDEVSAYPQGKLKKEKPVKQVRMLLLRNPAGEICLYKRPSSGIWGGLWSLPELDLDADTETHCREQQLTVTNQQALAELRHTFSHYHLDIHPMLIDVIAAPNKVEEANKRTWYNPLQPATLGLAAPVKRLLQELSERQ